MARTRNIRDYGAIPERRHDAFLLALLLALCLNVAFFVVQALIPRLAHLLQMLGPVPEAMREEEMRPFVLVDPALLDEDDPEQLAEAEANVSRRAAQAEPPPEELPEERTYQEEGGEHILTAPPGNPGEDISFQQVPGEVLLPELGEPAPEPPPEELLPDEPEEMPEAPEMPEPEPAPEPPPEMPAPEPVEEIPPPPEPIEAPPEMPEPPPEPFEEPVEEMAEEPPADELPPEPEPEPLSDMVDLAALPLSPDGFFDPRPDAVTETLLRERAQPAQPAQPTQAPQRPSREGRRQPTFKRVGGASSSGGAPPRRNQDSRIRLLESTNSMRYLAHKYGEYMEKLARALQHSLNRVVDLTPSTSYMRGNAKLHFRIAPDGSLDRYETEFPVDGTLVNVRMISEQMLREAAPFEPPTAEMLADPIFQKMTVNVFLE